ncbi:hypothetical protein LXH13_32495 [Streptomyces spinosirectus]|jgi:hypothetical protein|uniref:hypothetical protein n=1 Tax=Streptomyces TaxID=1883 RepID=UPI000FFF40A4|nr:MULTISPECIES: hypothetical protein [Streptomyces]MBY8341614.1 hypothetical protein [Streptomyces plumbidurans]UIR21479.1 hypothetical protein LXH13_32495 [Streptomyces spinosirectus]
MAATLLVQQQPGSDRALRRWPGLLEVTNTRGERLPHMPTAHTAEADPRDGGPGKTVWAECAV